jgi:hypothetical protein
VPPRSRNVDQAIPRDQLSNEELNSSSGETVWHIAQILISWAFPMSSEGSKIDKPLLFPKRDCI